MRSVPMPAVALISVGSNVDPERNVIAALAILQGRARVTGSSTFYRTDPLGPPGQPVFLNGIWRIETTLGPVQVREELLRPIEIELGRVRTLDRYAPRPIDLDLVLYDDLVMEDETFRLPHPDLVRPFVHVPVLELLNDGHVIERNLRSRMLHLVPTIAGQVEAGEPLRELTTEMRSMLISAAYQE